MISYIFSQPHLFKMYIPEARNELCPKLDLDLDWSERSFDDTAQSAHGKSYTKTAFEGLTITWIGIHFPSPGRLTVIVSFWEWSFQAVSGDSLLHLGRHCPCWVARRSCTLMCTPLGRLGDSLLAALKQSKEKVRYSSNFKNVR